MKWRNLIIATILISLSACSKETSTQEELETNNPGEGDIITSTSSSDNYTIVDTDQTTFYNNSSSMGSPASGQDFYGQDAQYTINAPSYLNNGDGTISDQHTGLMWIQSADRDGDDDIDVNDKRTYTQALTEAENLVFAGYSDWRLPTIKELYSLILFSGIDPSGYEGTSTAGLVPFINTEYFDFGYGDTDANERIIDAQYASATKYVSTTMNGDETLFGVNFADGRIKGYGMQLFGNEKTFYVIYVRGNENYGLNNFQNNNDGTITDEATGLMWTQADNAEGLNWKEALSYAENFELAGYSDWRLPNAKELQSIVDYSRSPEITSSAAIDPIFNCSSITNEAGQSDYPSYWTSSTHANWTTQNSGGNAAYISFGRAMGYMNSWVDVHGAGSQRSDPKTGDPSSYPTGHGPQGDAIRIYNYVRLVRTVD